MLSVKGVTSLYHAAQENAFFQPIRRALFAFVAVNDYQPLNVSSATVRNNRTNNATPITHQALR